MAVAESNSYNVQPAKKYYSDPRVIKGYTKVGLYPAEEILFSRYFKPGFNILDIGCGTGRTSIPLTKKGCVITGIDIVPGMIDVAKQQAQDHKVNIVFETMNALEMNFPSESFQYILFSFNGFEHILGKQNREKFLNDAFKILKPGGCFIFTARSGIAFGKRWLAWGGYAAYAFMAKTQMGQQLSTWRQTFRRLAVALHKSFSYKKACKRYRL